MVPDAVETRPNIPGKWDVVEIHPNIPGKWDVVFLGDDDGPTEIVSFFVTLWFFLGIVQRPVQHVLT